MTATSTIAATDFMVDRKDLRSSRFSTASLPAVPAPGEVLLAIDTFALTANNITYAAFGDAMQYWNFFPAADPAWGRVPVWGFADVIASACEGVAPGERIYGYFPMSTHVVLRPERVNAGGFVDGAAHRKGLHAVYNAYLRTKADPGYSAAAEAQQMLLRPLFTTSFLIDDFLADNGDFGAHAVILSSASSKTGYGAAFQLFARKAVEVIGLTSPANAGFVERLGCYDLVKTYDEIETIPNDVPTVYVDMAGNAALRAAIHHHFADSLKYSCAVGGTHWDGMKGEGRGAAQLPGPKPTLFFAPAQIKKRNADWGAQVLQQRIADAWRAFMAPVCDPARGWLHVIEGHGPAAVERVYLDLLDGKTRPDQGHILSLASPA